MFIDENFIPTHTNEKDLSKLADYINKPHEDYPHRVDITEDVLKSLEGWDKITKFDIMTIHSIVMNDLQSRGSYRKIDVKVGNWIPATPSHIQELMNEILPVTKDDDLELWYRRFQSIHPFEDGNGRVGGIVYYTLKNSIM